LHGAKELRLKESDRIGAMVEGLQRLGIDATDFDDGVVIKGGKIQGGRVDSRGDHRIAMSFAIAGAIAQGPITIDDCSNVATSFPDFVDTANKLHLNLETVVGL
jgi:3-phosphoshikimate 1-carboxyvinyltransferase